MGTPAEWVPLAAWPLLTWALSPSHHTLPPVAGTECAAPRGLRQANSAGTFSAFTHTLMVPPPLPLEVTPNGFHSSPVARADKSHFGNHTSLSECEGPVAPHIPLKASAPRSAGARLRRAEEAMSGPRLPPPCHVLPDPSESEQEDGELERTTKVYCSCSMATSALCVAIMQMQALYTACSLMRATCPPVSAPRVHPVTSHCTGSCGALTMLEAQFPFMGSTGPEKLIPPCLPKQWVSRLPQQPLLSSCVSSQSGPSFPPSGCPRRQPAQEAESILAPSIEDLPPALACGHRQPSQSLQHSKPAYVLGALLLDLACSQGVPFFLRPSSPVPARRVGVNQTDFCSGF